MIPATIVASVLFSLLFFGLTVRAMRRKRYMGSLPLALSGLLFLTTAALGGTILVATRGYRAFTREDIVFRITTEPVAHQRFRARVIYPDGRDTVYNLSGDQVYVDAHILKW